MPRRFLPLGEAFVQHGRLTPRWEGLLRDLILVPSWIRSTERASLAAALAPVVVVRNASPAASPTPSAPPSESSATLYRLSYYVRVVQPATVSSSVQVTLTWTDGGVTQTATGALLTGNTTTTLEQKTELLVHVDPDTPVEVSTTYASVGADPMVYDVEVAYEPVVHPTPVVRQRTVDV